MSLDGFKVILIMWGVMVFLLVFVGVPLAIYDSLYVAPVAAEKSNQNCQEQGFDFYEDYSRIGFLSKEPVAIICKYVEQYRNIDLNINGVKRK